MFRAVKVRADKSGGEREALPDFINPAGFSQLPLAGTAMLRVDSPRELDTLSPTGLHTGPIV